jgi:hypothetical protein
MRCRPGAAIRMHTRGKHIIYSGFVAFQSISEKPSDVASYRAGTPVWGSWSGFQQGVIPTRPLESGILLYAGNSTATGPFPEWLRHGDGVL